jgi:transposase
MKNYPPQFKADAVAQYQSRPEATIRQVTADLGINSETLRNWVRDAGASRPRGRRTQVPAEPPTPCAPAGVRSPGEPRGHVRPGRATDGDHVTTPVCQPHEHDGGHHAENHGVHTSLRSKVAARDQRGTRHRRVQ